MSADGRPVLVRVERWLRHEEQRVAEAVGGPARLKVIVLLACVVGLEEADTGTVGAVAAPLESALHVSNTQVGLLVTVSTAIGAAATLPVGVIVDRLNRVRLLSLSILVWSAAELAGSASQSYAWLLFTRLALGAVVATAYPTVASLVGDLFRVSERGRIYGFVLTGELAGAGVGILVAGNVGSLSWRASFAWLVLPGVALAGAIWRFLPEPARGGQSRLAQGAQVIPAAGDVAAGQVPEGTVAGDDAGPQEGPVEEEVEEQGIEARAGLILHRDPSQRSLWWAVRYVLSVPTNRLLIVASALGYFYFDGLRTFAVEFLRGRFGLGQGTASTLLVVIGIGAVAGALAAGRLADRLVTAGRVPARVWVAGASFLVAIVLLVPGLITTSMAVAIPLLFLGAAGLGGANSPLNAARLDIMHSRLWGRAESVRTALRSCLEAVAPLISTQFGNRGSGLGHPSGTVVQGATGLGRTFLIMLVPVAVAGPVMIGARRTYPRDVATAMRSEEITGQAKPGHHAARGRAAPRTDLCSALRSGRAGGPTRREIPHAAVAWYVLSARRRLRRRRDQLRAVLRGGRLR
jgi:predicted MFS family arabinose efflux permease